MRIRFSDVGRGKRTFEADYEGEPEIDGGPPADWLTKQVRPHLMSRDISFSEQMADGHGHIFAGMNIVGGFEILKAASDGQSNSPLDS